MGIWQEHMESKAHQPVSSKTGSFLSANRNLPFLWQGFQNVKYYYAKKMRHLLQNKMWNNAKCSVKLVLIIKTHRGESWKIREAEQSATKSYLCEIFRLNGVSCLHKFSDWMQCIPVSSYLIFLPLASLIPSCLHLPSAGIKGMCHHCLVSMTNYWFSSELWYLGKFHL